MSDTSEDPNTDRLNEKDDNICRDFIRGSCERKFCKFKHENDVKSLNFCHDFQNNVCPRQHCKFIHCTLEEVEEFKRTGDMSKQMLAEAIRKNQFPGNPPICHLFRKRMCRRTNCKYRHLTQEQLDVEIMELLQNNSQRQHNEVVNNLVEQFQPAIPEGISRRCDTTFDDYHEGYPVAKRRFIETQEPDLLGNSALNQLDRPRPIFKGYYTGNPPPPMLNRIDARSSFGLLLEEENSLLLKEIAQLKRQVSDLTATNEFLLDQNATLRVSGKRNGTVPAVSNSPQQPPQVIRTVTASVATVPVSLATVSTCNPVSVSNVSIAGCPAVSIASPAQLLAPSQQILVTTNPTTQLAIANSSQAQLAIAQQNLANNLAQQAQPQLTSQAQQLALATTTQQLTSQAQHMANQQLALASTPQPQQLTLTNQPQTHQQLNQQLTSQAQQLANQQLTSQAQQIALANTQQLTSQAQQLALANTTQQLTSQAQQLAMANTPQQFTVASVSPQQLALASTNQQLLQQNQQTIAMSNATQPMVSYPIMTQSINHALTH